MSSCAIIATNETAKLNASERMRTVFRREGLNISDADFNKQAVKSNLKKAPAQAFGNDIKSALRGSGWGCVEKMTAKIRHVYRKR